ARGEDPVEMVVHRLVLSPAAREAGQRGRHDAPLLRQTVEERRPLRQAPEAGKEAYGLAAPLLPDPDGLVPHLNMTLRVRHDVTAPWRRKPDARAIAAASAAATSGPPTRRTGP